MEETSQEIIVEPTRTVCLDLEIQDFKGAYFQYITDAIVSLIPEFKHAFSVQLPDWAKNDPKNETELEHLHSIGSAEINASKWSNKLGEQIVATILKINQEPCFVRLSVNKKSRIVNKDWHAREKEIATTPKKIFSSNHKIKLIQMSRQCSHLRHIPEKRCNKKAFFSCASQVKDNKNTIRQRKLHYCHEHVEIFATKYNVAIEEKT